MNWYLPTAECTEPIAVGTIWDFADYWARWRPGQPEPEYAIKPVQPDADSPQSFNRDGIRRLQSIYKSPDLDTIYQMESNSFDNHLSLPDVSVFVINHKSFFDNADHAYPKLKEEMSEGILLGPFPGNRYFPTRHIEQGMVYQNGKYRRTGDGSGPHNLEYQGKSLANNLHIDLEDHSRFPVLELPSAKSFAANAGIAMSLHHDTPGGRIAILLTDWRAFFRTLNLRTNVRWTQQLLCLPTGTLDDTSLYFGDRAAMSKACLTGDTLLHFWTCIFLTAAEAATTWDVLNQCDRQRGVRLLLHRPPGLSGFQGELIERVLDAEAHGWDADARTRTWRQDRYETARHHGLTEQEAILCSLPLTSQGYVDDIQTAVLDSLFMTWLASLPVLTQMTGIQLQMPKMVVARVVQGEMHTAMVHTLHDIDFNDASVNDIRIGTAEPGRPLVLGREVDIVTMRITEPPSRNDSTDKQTRDILKAADQSKHGIITTKAADNYIGSQVWRLGIAASLRALLNPILATRRTSTRMTSTVRGRKTHCPLSQEAAEAMQDLAMALKQHQGQVLNPDSRMPGRAGNPIIFLLNDSTRPENPQTSSTPPSVVAESGYTPARLTAYTGAISHGQRRC